MLNTANCPWCAIGGALLSYCMHTERRPGSLEQLVGIADISYGIMGAALLILHSFIDGGAIFAASKISVRLGIVVGLEVVAHDCGKQP